MYIRKYFEILGFKKVKKCRFLAHFFNCLGNIFFIIVDQHMALCITEIVLPQSYFISNFKIVFESAYE